MKGSEDEHLESLILEVPLIQHKRGDEAVPAPAYETQRQNKP
jgi:hypothetical protein